MPTYNVTLDDVSPMFVYNGVWSDTNTQDSEYVNYFNSTFHATQQQGAQVTLQFFGTAVSIFGAKRGNHDRYTITLDGASQFGNGFAADPGLYQQVLFTAGNLTSTVHTLVIQDSFTNAARPFVDVDFATFTTGDGNASGSSVDTSVDDGDSSIQYSGSWDNSPNGVSSQYFNSTMHRTSTSGDTVNFQFNGNAITVYGATSTNHATYTVSLDGSPATTYFGNASAFRPQMVLYYMSGLSNNTAHTITLTNTGSGGNGFFDIDRFVVSQWFAGAKTGSGSSGSNGSGNSSDKSSSGGSSVAGIAAGVAVGTAVAILTIVAAIIIVRRRRRRADQRPGAEKDPLDLSAGGPGTPGGQGYPHQPYYHHVTPGPPGPGTYTSGSDIGSGARSLSSPSIAPTAEDGTLLSFGAAAGAASVSGSSSRGGGKRGYGRGGGGGVGRGREGTELPYAASEGRTLSPTTTVSDLPETRYQREHGHYPPGPGSHARTTSGSTGLFSQPHSSEPEQDAGPAFNAFETAPPSYGQVFVPRPDGERNAKTPAWTTVGASGPLLLSPSEPSQYSYDGSGAGGSGDPLSPGMMSPLSAGAPSPGPPRSREGRRQLPTVPQS